MKNSRSFVPLNDSQMGIYLDCFQNPESTMYNIPVCHRYKTGQVDVPRLADSVRQALAYFTRELGGVEVDSNLPVDRPDAAPGLQGSLLAMELDVPFDNVEQIARRYDVTKGTIFLTAFAYALADHRPAGEPVLHRGQRPPSRASAVPYGGNVCPHAPVLCEI